MILIGQVTKNLFFTGKGGVGKTSVASATAVALADQGKRVLLVSTDPASNLDEVFGTKLGNVGVDKLPTPIREVPNLSALNIDPEAAAHSYRERMVGPYIGILPDATVQSMEERFSGACTTEIAAFDEFSKLLGNPDATSNFDHVIFDTAPTGHTLRLLKLPAAWTTFFDNSVGGNSCLGPLSGLSAQRSLYEGALHTLADRETTTLVLVSRAEKAALAEAARTSHELAELGINNQQLVINGLFKATNRHDQIASALESRGTAAMLELPDVLRSLTRVELPLLPFGLVGVSALRALGSPGHPTLEQVDITPANRRPADSSTEYSDSMSDRLSSTLSISELIDSICATGRGVILTMGKGGVGKTTVATLVALELARRGHSVNLSTTDPAAHLDLTLGSRTPNLSVTRIHPAVEIAQYTAEVLATAGEGLDQQGRALLEEDLRSPCTEEIAVFRAFARTVDQGQDSFVVLDTAPTGHTLLLLDATESYHREVLRSASQIPEEVRQLLPRLRDKDFTKVLLITLPEATPVHEAATLQSDLVRAKITPYAWIINQSLTPLSVTDPLLTARQLNERDYISEVTQDLSNRTVLLTWNPETGN